MKDGPEQPNPKEHQAAPALLVSPKKRRVPVGSRGSTSYSHGFNLLNIEQPEKVLHDSARANGANARCAEETRFTCSLNSHWRLA